MPECAVTLGACEPIELSALQCPKFAWTACIKMQLYIVAIAMPDTSLGSQAMPDLSSNHCRGMYIQ